MVLTLVLSGQKMPVTAHGEETYPNIFGQVHDIQEQAVNGAKIILEDDKGVIGEALTQPDGRFALEVEAEIEGAGILRISRPHFNTRLIQLERAQAEILLTGESIELEEIILPRRITHAFWISAIIFMTVLLLIATGRLHNTLAALVGAALILGVSYLGSPFIEDLYIFDFARSMEYIDWNVIFLIMGMMMLVAIVEKTGIFQWMAFIAYRISGGKMVVLLPILMLITGIASALLDNVTTMLLITPITVQIAMAVGINPLALLIPEVMASNVIGVSTLIGTPTNILIGSFAEISFNDFLINLTPGVLLAFVGLLIYSNFIYRKDLTAVQSTTDVLVKKLEERAQITQADHLRKAGWVGLGMLLMFVFGERIHLLPAVTALIGSTTLLVWIRPDIEEMIEAVDWTTLVFFMSLFIVVGAIQEVGLISYIAVWIGDMVGESLLISMAAVTFLSAILSMVIANIPFTAAMLPVIGYLTTTVPGAETKALFFCLSVGAAMGGNGTLIGASANMITAGIAEAGGFRISYAYFLKKGFPAVVITVTLAFLWLLYRFL